ncbi:uncharacterized protein PV06_03889 [Exophiala oligosperma]|uniref:Uncharacterized protein n=1 Tax=Exophiala oligosperma TaxID=215243 RepID=A0A0D2DRH6_9EURO|nr:uncharacterized protein PV06_03889 [Exophiala oligosperma]KIW45503.1 hypothetical protein PV06_03889 [Exophiala oligosperma]
MAALLADSELLVNEDDDEKGRVAAMPVDAQDMTGHQLMRWWDDRGFRFRLGGFDDKGYEEGSLVDLKSPHSAGTAVESGSPGQVTTKVAIRKYRLGIVQGQDEESRICAPVPATPPDSEGGSRIVHIRNEDSEEYTTISRTTLDLGSGSCIAHRRKEGSEVQATLSETQSDPPIQFRKRATKAMTI